MRMLRKCLSVGINKYPTAPLRCAVNDATAFANLMETHGYTHRVSNFDVTLSTDVPTKGKLMGLIKNLFSGKNETALFYFAGHGYLDEFGGYIVTPDAQRDDVGIDMNMILAIANECKSDNKIIILDCCHSGAMGSSATSGNGIVPVTSGVTILTACNDAEKAVEVNGHGMFTNLLLNALEGGAADLQGHITPGSVYAYIDLALGAWDQRPVFKTNITQFTPLRSVMPQVQGETLYKIVDYFPAPGNLFGLDPEYEFTYPESKPDKVAKFKDLQKMESVGLVVPIGEEHMYYAAMNSKSCKLTALGSHYWRLVKDRRI